MLIFVLEHVIWWMYVPWSANHSKPVSALRVLLNRLCLLLTIKINKQLGYFMNVALYYIGISNIQDKLIDNVWLLRSH